VCDVLWSPSTPVFDKPGFCSFSFDFFLLFCPRSFPLDRTTSPSIEECSPLLSTPPKFLCFLEPFAPHPVLGTLIQMILFVLPFFFDHPPPPLLRNPSWVNIFSSDYDEFPVKLLVDSSGFLPPFFFFFFLVKAVSGCFLLSLPTNPQNPTFTTITLSSPPSPLFERLSRLNFSPCSLFSGTLLRKVRLSSRDPESDFFRFRS